jgi:hypothetical protein
MNSAPPTVAVRKHARPPYAIREETQPTMLGSCMGRRIAMPWTRKQVKTAQAVEHGWKPKGSAKGFDKGFADLVVRETQDGKLVKRAESKLGKGARLAPKR